MNNQLSHLTQHQAVLNQGCNSRTTSISFRHHLGCS